VLEEHINKTFTYPQDVASICKTFVIVALVQPANLTDEQYKDMGKKIRFLKTDTVDWLSSSTQVLGIMSKRKSFCWKEKLCILWCSVLQVEEGEFADVRVVIFLILVFGADVHIVPVFVSKFVVRRL
jgi:hypothetical protein